MASQKDDPIERKELKKRLTSDISSLRTRGLGTPKAGDRSDLLKIAVLYAPRQTTDADRIEALIETAVTQKYGGTLLAHVSRLAIGADLAVRGEGHEVRYKAAWEAYGTGTYSSFRTSMLPKIGEDLAAQIVKIYEDGEERGWDVVTYEPPQEVEDEPPPESEAPIPPPVATPTEPGKSAVAKWYRRLPRPVYFFLLFMAGLAVVGVVWAIALTNGSSTADAVPKPGTVINALTGKPVAHPVVKAPNKLDEPQIDPLRFCDLSDHKECKTPIDAVYYTEAEPFVAKAGDTIEARFNLASSGPKPLPYFRLEVRAGKFQGQTQEEVQNFILLPSSQGMASYSPKELALPKYGEHFQMVEVKGTDSPQVAYVPGSTELWKANGELLTRLPDGIMGRRGIYLTELGTPENCLCPGGGEGFREISFKFKVLD